MGGCNNVKLGFIATASSQRNNNYKASNAFNCFYTVRGASGEWVSNNETRNFWIRVKCPDLVRIWKVTLRERETNTQRIYRWKLASTDGENFITLFEAPNPTYLGNEVQQFEVDIIHKYNRYRLFCLEAEPSNRGLSYLQLFIYSD